MNTISLPIAYFYLRYSTKKQKKGDSGRRQSTLAEWWCKKNGYQLKEISDEGKSAFRGDHMATGQLGVFVAELRAGKLGSNPWILIEAFDRLSREPLQTSLSLFLDLINSGATIVTLTEGKTYKSPLSETEAMEAISSLNAANKYAARLSFLINADWDQRREIKLGEQGIAIHRGTTPGWIKQIAKDVPFADAFAVMEDRAKIVREIFRLYLSGLGTVQLARYLNGAKVAPFTHKGQKSQGWHGVAVLNILRNRAVLGWHQPHKNVDKWRRTPIGEPVKCFPPVVSEEDFDLVAARLNAVQKRGRPIKSYWNLVKGLGFSGVDGSPMWGQKATPTRQKELIHYLKSRRSMTHDGPSHFIRYNDFEVRLIELMKQIDAEAFEVPAQGEDALEAVGAAQKDVTRLTRIYQRYRAILEGDKEPEAEISADYKEAARKLAEAKRTLALARERFRNDQIKFGIVEADLSLPDDRAKIHAAIVRTFERIVFDRDVAHCWFNEKTRQGVDIPLAGPIVFNVPLPLGVEARSA